MDQSQRRLLPELEERLEQIFAAIEELRESASDGKVRRRLIDSIFRVVHSVKASASTGGFDDLARISHEFEDLLHSLRVGRTKLDDDVLRAFDETADALYACLTPDEVAVNVDHPTVSAEKRQSLEPQSRRTQAEVEIVLAFLSEEIWHSLSEQEKHRLQESVGEGASLYLVTTNFDIDSFDQKFQSLKERLIEKGEIISTAPKVDVSRPDRIDFRILYAREAELDEIKTELSLFADVSINEFGELAASNRAGHAQSSARIEYASRATPKSIAPREHTIRINLDDLDRIISITHKLFRQTTNGLTSGISSSSDRPALQAQLQSLSDRVSDSFLNLAAQLVDLRMVPIERVLQRALRSGRRAAYAAGKDIDFVVQGRELMLDKSLSDAIADPVIHLVRNAVDHGIESSGERKIVGKNERGTIRVEAATIQGQTRITVSDDGRGIQPTTVSRAAKQLGLVDKDSVMSMEQSVRMIFRPGFSTAADITSTSGRGVGLDVVETAIEEVGGEIRVVSMAGIGSVFEIRMPVTFGLLDTLIVSVAGRRYLLDQAHVAKRITLYPGEIETTDSGSILKIDDEELPVCQLSQLLELRPDGYGDEASHDALVYEFTKERPDGVSCPARLALVVERIIDTEKVLVRNLGSRGSRWFGVAGASELRDGTVALLLDLPRLITAATRDPHAE